MLLQIHTFARRVCVPLRLWVQKYLSSRVKRTLKYPIWRSLIFAVIVQAVVIMLPIPSVANNKDKAVTCHSAPSLKENKVSIFTISYSIHFNFKSYKFVKYSGPTFCLSGIICTSCTAAIRNQKQEMATGKTVPSTSTNEIWNKEISSIFSYLFASRSVP